MFDNLEEAKQKIKENYSNEEIIEFYLDMISNFEINSDEVVNVILDDHRFLSVNNFGYEDINDLLEV